MSGIERELCLIVALFTCYKLGPMPNGHAGEHADVPPDPKINDILVAAKNSRPNAPTLVSVYRGCGCRFIIYPKST